VATKRKKQRPVNPGWNPKRPFTERDGGKLLTREEVADVLGTTERHIREMIQRGDIPMTKVGPKVRIHKDDVDAYIEAQRVKAVR
jgi:excisionase family DNA binding protein